MPSVSNARIRRAAAVNVISALSPMGNASCGNAGFIHPKSVAMSTISLVRTAPLTIRTVSVIPAAAETSGACGRKGSCYRCYGGLLSKGF